MLVRCGCEGGGKGALIQEDVSATLSCANTQTLFQPTICMGSTQTNAEVTEDFCPAQCARQYKDPPILCFQQNTRDEVRYINGDGSIAGALAANSGAKQTNYILCVADDNVNAAIDEDMSGSLKVGGGQALRSLPSNGDDVVGALCARDFKGIGNQYVSEGKVILQWNESTR